jgi:hypothetical protein
MTDIKLIKSRTGERGREGGNEKKIPYIVLGVGRPKKIVINNFKFSKEKIFYHYEYIFSEQYSGFFHQLYNNSKKRFKRPNKIYIFRIS